MHWLGCFGLVGVSCFVLVCLLPVVGGGLSLGMFSPFGLWIGCWLLLCLVGVGGWFVFFGEFDPGSGRTLAACLTHASRTVKPFFGWMSGERVSNT